jgi:hypothetical protein
VAIYLGPGQLVILCILCFHELFEMTRAYPANTNSTPVSNGKMFESKCLLMLIHPVPAPLVITQQAKTVPSKNI